MIFWISQKINCYFFFLSANIFYFFLNFWIYSLFKEANSTKISFLIVQVENFIILKHCWHMTNWKTWILPLLLLFFCYFNICVFLMFCYSPLWPMAYSNPIFVCLVRIYVDFNIVIIDLLIRWFHEFCFHKFRIGFTKCAARFDLLKTDFVWGSKYTKKDKKPFIFV